MTSKQGPIIQIYLQIIYLFYLSLVILVFCNSIKLSTQELLEIDRTNKLNYTIDKTSGLILQLHITMLVIMIQRHRPTCVLQWYIEPRIQPRLFVQNPSECIFGTSRIYPVYKVEVRMSTCSNPFECVAITNAIYSQYRQNILTEVTTK